ncbi:MAG: dephospho-CoA kinase [Myxococcota bacterium]|jgi:dephospho-CoA kinase
MKDTPPVIAGLTGGIATGKSVVAQMMRDLGAAVIDSDALGHDVIAPGGPACGQVKAAFGDAILSPEGAIDRSKVASIVFSDPAKLRLLESITHPLIIATAADRMREAAKSGYALIVMESAIIYELHIEGMFQTVVTVYADPAVQLDRLMARGGLSRAEARLRIDAQMPVAEKARLSAHVIDNSGSLEKTRAQVAALVSSLIAHR